MKASCFLSVAHKPPAVVAAALWPAIDGAFKFVRLETFYQSIKLIKLEFPNLLTTIVCGNMRTHLHAIISGMRVRSCGGPECQQSQKVTFAFA